METVRLEISPTPANVRTARLVAVAVARQAGLSDAVLDEIRLAVGEACARAVGLHSRHAPFEPIRIEFEDSPRFSVAVRDVAPAQQLLSDVLVADPLKALAAQAGAPSNVVALPVESGGFSEEELAAGVGLALLAGLVDDLAVNPAEDGSGFVVRMSWPLD